MLEDTLFFFTPKYLKQTDLQEICKIPSMKRIFRHEKIDIVISEYDVNQTIYNTLNKY